ncbi:TlpA disulfide reductase family protein [Parabacteroides faecis]|uniref:Peroxiredoxin n=1 Tax=Parabacteroides faecis TaxID=1217282 RepID=A0ABR6KS05_9BACT|nr:TlpA disulfide reductase family protein [Parabacteroides faecis]MBB4624220.1 peroxiredoxin [Parabacteroides faecis]MCS2890895.1 AhpC/TSA family protein [Parabacteroides faecis]
MIKHLLLIFGVALFLSSCGKDVSYRIEGKLSNLEDETLYAVFENDNNKVVDTITCEKPGQFSLKRNEGDFNTVTIFFDHKKSWTTAYLIKGEKVTITGDALYPALLQVKGGRINDQLNSYRKSVSPLLKEQADLIKILTNKGSYTNTTEETDIPSRLTNVNHTLSERAMEYIQEHPDEEASVVLLQYYFMNPDDTRKMDELLAVLSPKLKDFYLIRKLQEYSAKAQRTSLGAEAPGFNVKNVYGHTVSLDSFPQRYLLLAFTAPWCDMCQTEDLFLDKVAMKYPKEKVDMLLISLDDDPQEVRKLLSKDSIDWNLVTDSAGQATMLVDLYNVNTLPRCFLIDEDGKIIMKTDNGVEIQQTLEKLIEK